MKNNILFSLVPGRLSPKIKPSIFTNPHSVDNTGKRNLRRYRLPDIRQRCDNGAHPRAKPLLTAIHIHDLQPHRRSEPPRLRSREFRLHIRPENSALGRPRHRMVLQAGPHRSPVLYIRQPEKSHRHLQHQREKRLRCLGQQAA